MRASTGNIIIREADTIWHEQGGWFDARWHFSFDRYRDPEQMGVGALRVFNDDRIVAGAEWPLHPHQDIESLTYVVEGTSSTTIPSATTGASSLVLPRR